MTRRLVPSRCVESEAFDMTPVIDVVFLLIIFFMLVCQFITAEQFRVHVPEQIASAVPQKVDEHILTLSILPDDAGRTIYAAGHQRLDIQNPDDIAALFAAAIDEFFRAGPLSATRTVRLRCDASVTFGQVRPVLEGIAHSAATDVDWAVRSD